MDITGTSGNDVLEGTAADDRIEGLGGNDTIEGRAGNDVLSGGDGSDFINGGAGDDFVDGGTGDDFLYDFDGGSDSILGGAGRDRISISHGAQTGSNYRIQIDAGTEDDEVDLFTTSFGTATVSLGDGDDRLTLRGLGATVATVALGTGRDTVAFEGFGVYSTVTRVDDFAADDVIEVDAYLASVSPNWTGQAPFGASGFLRLEQQGADVSLSIDRDGAAGTGFAFTTLLTLRNVQLSALTAANLNGFDPAGGATQGVTRAAGPNGGTLRGSAGGDVLTGSATFDRIEGRSGDDLVNAGDGNDSVDGGFGDDTLNGEGGDDFLTDQAGSDTLNGGAGNDRISVSHFRPGAVVERIVVDAGIGDDVVDVQQSSTGAGSVSVDLGDGADELTLSGLGGSTASLRLGAGLDKVKLGEFGQFNAAITVADFVAGDAGEVFDITAYVGRTLQNWNGDNPFGTGHLRLRQSGPDALLEIDRDGPGTGGASFTTLAVFQNATAAAFTAANLGGYPPDGSRPQGRTITGTANVDRLIGGAGDDVISGLGGADYIEGGAGGDLVEGGDGADTIFGGLGRDTLNGGEGADTLNGDAGDDVLDGGADNDFLRDTTSGSDTLRGGAGNDDLTVSHYPGSPAAETVAMDGGVGDDVLAFGANSTGTASLLGGDGADRITLNGSNGAVSIGGGEGVDLVTLNNSGGTVSIALGAGRDVLKFGQFLFQANAAAVTDFAAGAAGDAVSLRDYLQQQLFNWNGSDPFAGGYLRLVQLGADTILQVDRDASTGSSAFATVLKLRDTVATALTADNFEGWTPVVATVGGTVNGTPGNDFLSGSIGDDVILAGAGEDTVRASSGTDSLDGGAGVNDRLELLPTDGSLFASTPSGPVAYTITSTRATSDTGSLNSTLSGFESLYVADYNGRGVSVDASAFAGRAQIFIGRGVNTVRGTAGDDNIATDVGTATIDAGAGFDFVQLRFDQAGGAVTLAAANGAVSVNQNGAAIATVRDAEQLSITAFGTLGNRVDASAVAVAVQLEGSGGVDTLVGGAGGDRFTANNAGEADSFTGGAGADTFSALSFRTLGLGTRVTDFGLDDFVDFQSARFNDGLTLSFLGTGAFTGVAGQYRYGAANGRTVVEADRDGDGAADARLTLSNGEFRLEEVSGAGSGRLRIFRESVIVGTDADDQLFGTAAPDTISGRGGADRISGQAGDDRLFGEAGRDTIFGGADNDLVDGGDDDDSLYGDAGADRLFGGDGADTVFGGAGDDLVDGGAGNDFLYGDAGVNEIRGGAGNDFLKPANSGTAPGGDGIVDGGDGFDRISYFNEANGVTVDLRIVGAQQTGRGLHTISNVEHLSGTRFSDTLIGDGAANWLWGSDGGNDRLVGNGGDDLLVVGPGAHVVDGGVGVDTLAIGIAPGGVAISLATQGQSQDFGQGSVTITAVENLSGSAFNDALTGDAGRNTLAGAAGDDTLLGGAGADLLLGDGFVNADTSPNGGSGPIVVRETGGGAGNDVLDGGAGADRMVGGAGNDTYFIDDKGDRVVEAAGEGVDTANSTISIDFGTVQLDNLVLLGASNLFGYGNALDNAVTGNAGANTLDGRAGDDTLDGRGGADRMIGGMGNDTYYLDNSGDRIVELAGEGVDTAISTISVDFSTVQLDNLTLTGTANLFGYGNELDNVLIGNAGANVLDGRAGDDMLDGGAGADRMIGGAGNDTYRIDNAGDRVVEAAGGGVDLAISSISIDFGTVQLDDLLLTGSANLFGYGNELDNLITGNAGANTLDGRGGDDTLDGGAGADRMVGGTGDDTYVIDSAGDRVVELAGEGVDTAVSSISIDFGSVQLDNLVLTGSGNLFGYGNALDNVLTGNAGDNALRGRGGADVLTGGAGADQFRFDTAPAAGNVDRITDLEVGVDRIELARSVFGAIGAGRLSADAFRVGTAAADASDRVVYDVGTGNLFYDADGDGAGAAVLFATLQAGLQLTNADIFGV